MASKLCLSWTKAVSAEVTVVSKFFVLNDLNASTLRTNCDLMSFTSLKMVSCCVSAASKTSAGIEGLTRPTASAKLLCEPARLPATGETLLESEVGVTLELALAEVGVEDPEEVDEATGGEDSLALPE